MIFFNRPVPQPLPSAFSYAHVPPPPKKKYKFRDILLHPMTYLLTYTYCLACTCLDPAIHCQRLGSQAIQSHFLLVLLLCPHFFFFLLLFCYDNVLSLCADWIHDNHMSH